MQRVTTHGNTVKGRFPETFERGHYTINKDTSFYFPTRRGTLCARTCFPLIRFARLFRGGLGHSFSALFRYFSFRENAAANGRKHEMFCSNIQFKRGPFSCD